MIRRLKEQDKNLYIELAKEFYESDAVLHTIPESYIEDTFKEMMRSEEYVIGYMLECDKEPAGYALTCYTFSQEAGGKTVWLEELYIRPEYRCKGLGKEFFAYLDQKIAPNVRRIRLEIEPDNVRAKKLYLAMGYEDLAYAQMIKDVQEGSIR